MAAPTFSVIIPSYDRPARLAACLEALARQDYPRELWEVVLVDDGTPDRERVAGAVEPMRGRFDLQVLRQANAGPATARNAGAARARFEYLAFTDDDCQATPGWLSALARALERNPQAFLGGRVVNRVEASLCSEASHQLVEYVVEYYLRKGAPFFPSNNIALATASFRQVGGFDLGFPLAAGEDRDLCAKCKEAGIELLSAPEAVVEHRHPMKLRAFLRQHYNYGRGAFVCHQLEARRHDHKIRVEPLRFYMDLLCSPFRSGRPARGRVRVALLLFLSQAANALGFFAEKFRRGRRGAGR